VVRKNWGGGGMLKNITTRTRIHIHTLMSTFLSFAGCMVGKAHGLRPDEWERANRALPLWDVKQ
jgi:hypothetical protein